MHILRPEACAEHAEGTRDMRCIACNAGNAELVKFCIYCGTALATACDACGQSNPVVANFCSECGSSLAIACTRCGNRNPAMAKFCMECGSRVERAGAGPAHRAAKAAPIRYLRVPTSG